MPSFTTARRIASTKNNGAKTLGQIYKEDSDFLMEETWDSDLQSKVCYIYDYYHDDKPWLAEDITHENTTKTRIDAKFIVTKYSSIDKDQVEYHLQFRPSQPVRFTEGDELYYYETDYKQRYSTQFPIGLFVDIPDEKNVYRKWLIVAKEEGNQFLKYLILPCNYYFHWIEENGNQRIKRKMWAVKRNQNSYNSGLWTDHVTTSVENQSVAIFPTNPITSKLYYTHSTSKKNQRMIVSGVSDNPIVWVISKVDSTQPLGIYKITLYQDMWNQNTDYVDKDELLPDGNRDVFAMYADYYPTASTTPIKSEDMLKNKYNAVISTSTSMIKVGGSYKKLTLTIFDEGNVDITNDYLLDKEIQWTCAVENVELNSNLSENIIWKETTNTNQIMIKFKTNRSYIGETLTIVAKISDKIEAMLQLNITS